MNIQIQHLPQDKNATREEEWGFTIWEFITGNWIYLLAIAFLIFIFLFARYRWRKRKQKEQDEM